ncbi:hypothetical protein PoB_006895600 [Plakobranchus ocellatus]|uniref:Uncharacterized protein n=1 Tax=Plakobranchus ocellatus TaxID=259542 RepID=A0AAV4DF61_9GAST|nr:hypothetical protein PoB_006895600 [Plakobranchus ocellatus]
MVANLKSSILDILQPSTCKRGMVRPLSSFPYPHPVIHPRDKAARATQGWILIQRCSTLFNVDFYRDWATYKKASALWTRSFGLETSESTPLLAAALGNSGSI